MIRVVMFDLGGTLLDAQGHPFAAVMLALHAITAMRASNGKPLATCLVSDFPLVPPPPTAAKSSLSSSSTWPCWRRPDCANCSNRSPNA